MSGYQREREEARHAQRDRVTQPRTYVLSGDPVPRNHPEAAGIIAGALLDIMAEPNLSQEEAATDYILKQLNDAGFGVVRLED